jgi:carbamoyltransferase
MRAGNAERVLGIWDGHNASACLVEAGRIVAAVAEERLSRVKMQPGFPARAIESVLKLAGTSPDDVGTVALAARYGRLPLRAANSFYARGARAGGPLDWPQRLYRHYENLMALAPGLRAVEAAASSAIIRGRLATRGFRRDVEIRSVLHHKAHAAAAASMFHGESVIVTMDGYGDGTWATVQRARRASPRMNPLVCSLYFGSPAVTYGSACQLLGYKEGEEGKVTALAAGGDPAALSPFFAGKLGDPGRLGMGTGGPLSRREVAHVSAHRPEDVAAGLQAALEEYVARFLAWAGLTGEAMAGGPGAARPRANAPAGIGLAGGLFANVAINRCVFEQVRPVPVRVFPAMGDEGLSVGAALSAAAGGAAAEGFPGPFLGEGIDDAEARSALSRAGLEFSEPADAAAAVAAELATGRCVAIVAGREEFGPRALGHRSLLFPADSIARADLVQGRLGRDRVMPFAPVCRCERVKEAFHPPFPDPARFDRGLGLMTFCVPARSWVLRKFPAAVHRDGTCRVQAATREGTPLLYRILTEYERRTGRELLINTSFNRHGEPIVHGPEDAVSTFLHSGIEAMLLGRYLVRRGPEA